MKPLLHGLWLALASACVLAQTSDERLTCGRFDDLVTETSMFPSPKENTYNEAERACWLDWASARDIAFGPNGQWVDVRDIGARRHLRLMGVTTVELSDLPTKAFLKQRALVLIGTGADLKPLSAKCVALRQSGQFKSLHVLLHGTSAWRKADQPVQADGSVLAIDEASAQDLWFGARGDEWLLATIGLSKEQLESLPVKPTFTSDTSNLQDAVTSLAARLTQKTNLSPHQRWLVLTQTPAQLAELRALWHQHHTDQAIAPIWLIGAWPAYASYLDQQIKLAAHSGRPLPRLCGM